VDLDPAAVPDPAPARDPARDLSAAARSAIDAIRRGVIAYSAVAD
jgi:hypothetical protein